MIGGLIGGVIDREILFKQKPQQGPRLEELKVQISTYGAPIPELWGTMRLAGNMIWADELNEVESTDGGKSTPEQTSYKYDATFAIGLCKGPISGMIRVWADSTLIYDARATDVEQLPSDVSGTVVSYVGGTMEVLTSATSILFVTNFGFGRWEITFDTGALAGQSFEIAHWNSLTNEFRLNEFPFTAPDPGDEWHIAGLSSDLGVNPRDNGTFDFTLYLGDESQDPDPTIEAVEGAGNVPAFRGLAYIVIRGFRLEQYGNRIPNFTFEIAKDTTVVNQVVAYPDSVLQSGPEPPETPDIFDWTMLLWSDGHTVITEGFAFDTLIGLFTANVNGSPGYLHPCFDFDETGIIYSVNNTTTTAGFEKWVKYDLDLGFTQPIASGAELAEVQFPDESSIMRVSKNPTYPLMWWFDGNASLRVCNRDNLGAGAATFMNPEDDNDFNGAWIDLDDATGTAWITFVKTSGTDRVFLRRVRPDPIGGWLYNDWEITSHLALPATIDNVMVKYDATTSQIIIGVSDAYFPTSPDSDHLYFFDISSGAPVFVDVMDDVDGLSLGGSYAAFRQGPFNGKMYFAAGVGDDITTFRYIRIDLATREVDGEWYPEAYGGAFTNFAYIPSLNAIFGDWYDEGFTNQGIHQYYVLVLLDRVSDAGAPLSLIVSDISELVNLSAAEINVTALTDTVNGYLLNSRMSARAAIEPLMQAYFFDAVEVDGKVKFVKRGGSSIVSIPESDLAAHFSGSQRPQELITTRQQELELPQTVEISYIDRLFDYQVGTQRERRLVTRSQEKMHIRLPISLTNDQAKQIAVKMLGLAWLQRTRHDIFVSRKYMWLTPTDVITVNEGGVARIVRIEDGSYEGGVIRFPLVQEDSETYESDAPGVGGTGGPGGDYPPVVPVLGVSRFVIADIPTLPEFAGMGFTAQVTGVYVGATGMEETWTGTTLWKSRDGSNWAELQSLPVDGVVGKAAGVLADVADPFIWDLGNSVQVQIFDPDDTLTSAEELAVLNGSNLAMLGTEVISFRTVVDNGDGLFTLSNLMRGRYGTDDQTGNHVVGEDFLLLTSSQIKFAQLSPSERNTLVYFRAVTTGQAFADGSNRSKTVTFRNLTPLSPQHVLCYRDPADLILIIIEWKRRTRFGGEWNDGAEVPIGETVEAYEIDLYSGSTFLRTVYNETVGGQALSFAYYLETQQILDGVGYDDPVTAIVYQISTAVGRGIASDPAISNQ